MKVVFDVYGVYLFYYGQDSLRKYYLKRWMEENLNLYVVYFCIYLVSSVYIIYNCNFSDYYLFDFDYFCFKILLLGYIVLFVIVKNWGLQLLKVYVIGENFFMVCVDKKMEDFDLEIVGGVIYMLGIKLVVFGVNILF